MYVVEFAADASGTVMWFPVRQPKAYNAKPQQYASWDEAADAMLRFRSTQPNVLFRVIEASMVSED